MSDEVAAPAVSMKAYDMGGLLEKLKVEGLELAEDAAGKVVVGVLDWIADSAKASATPYDDMALVILPKLKEFILSEVDKIDGKEGV